MDKKPVFEIHLEEWNHALHVDGGDHKSDLFELLNLLLIFKVNPVIYMLKDWEFENKRIANELRSAHYLIKSHGIHHYYDEKADRSPYFNQEGQPGLCGGFFFRVLPLWIVKKEVIKTGLFYIHPHDLDIDHPKLKNPLMDFKRRVGLKTARAKLVRLLKEIEFGTPS